MKKIAIIVFLLLFPLKTFAYIGPGLGLGAIGAVLSFLFSIFVLIFGLLFFPIKKLIKKLKKKNKETNDSK